MNKSIFELIFPHPTSSVLPHYEDDFARPPSLASSSNRISLRDSSCASPEQTPSPNPSHSTLQSAPLSVSVVHHDDPFLPVERAARSLEKTLQSLLDAQSDALEATLPNDDPDDVSSVGSPTPTPSVAGTSRSRHEPPPKLVPIRQPKPKKPSLRSARRGLTKTMEQFATLKTEELKVISHESLSRKAALQRSQQYTDKRAALTTELQSAQAAADDSRANGGAAALRSEAAKVQTEIHELETRLFELRTRHRHLLAQADQHDNTVASKLSSYKYSLAAVDRDVRQFLRHPPVPGSLAAYDHSLTTHGGMYSLSPGRRTLEMAADQWGAEQLMLQRRRDGVEREQRALRQGATMWGGAAERIADFERYLRRKVRAGEEGSGGGAGDDDSDDLSGEEALVSQLDDLITSLQRDYGTAKGNEWNLLLVCLGAELAALRRARALLTGVEEVPEAVYEEAERESALEDILLDQSADGGPTDGPVVREQAELLTDDDDDESLGPPDDLLINGAGSSMAATVTAAGTAAPAAPAAVRRRDSVDSNQSLQDTLRQLAATERTADDKGKGKAPAAATATAVAPPLTPATGLEPAAAEAEEEPEGESEASRETALQLLLLQQQGRDRDGRISSNRSQRSDSGDDGDEDPGPDFWLSHA